MSISAYNSLGYLNRYSSGLFNSNASTTSSGINNLYSLTSQASYYKTMAKYAITSKYATNQSASNSNSTSTSGASTQFLSNFDSNYSRLKSATDSLTRAVSKDNTDVDETVAAAQDFVKAYNSTSNFLSDHASTSTYRLNMLKNSLTNIGSSNRASLSTIGITQNNDGTLTLDSDRLKTALTNNSSSVTRTLNQVTSLTEVSTSTATNTSKLGLINEQTTASSTSSNISTDDDSYTKFLAMSKNSTQLKNYYYSLASLGIFMDISI